MTKADVDNLCVLIRKRDKTMKAAADHRAAELKADFEAKLAAIYDYDQDEVWQAAVEAAEAEVQRAQKTIEDRSAELGIPRSFAPGIYCGWHRRGESAAKDRRAELRTAAYARIDAITKKAKTQIEQFGLGAQSQVIIHGLESDAAKAFLDQLPSVEELMPPLQVYEIRGLLPGSKHSDAEGDDD